MEVVLLIEPEGTAEALAEDGQITLGEKTHRHDLAPVRQGNATRLSSRLNGL